MTLSSSEPLKLENLESSVKVTFSFFFSQIQLVFKLGRVSVPLFSVPTVITLAQVLIISLLQYWNSSQLLSLLLACHLSHSFSLCCHIYSPFILSCFMAHCSELFNISRYSPSSIPCSPRPAICPRLFSTLFSSLLLYLLYYPSQLTY